VQRILISLMLLVTTAAANAEWTTIGKTNEFTAYVDKTTIQHGGRFIKMNSLKNLEVPKRVGDDPPYLSLRAQVEYDCTDKQQRTLSLTFLSGNMGEGKVIFTDPLTSEWTPITPTSFVGIEWEIACGKK
jgi:hypothetical protein